ncbi:septation protein SepH [Parafrankia elaeagni]|uniref:septation protein SepH n=1 Tax=Parafrankia elaeagni TaxID=222534 RepID=UPI0003A9E882|nr:septation protein SepH [Parafrankia elaeagni]
MRELRAVALSEDGGYLVLADAAGRADAEQFRVAVDDRLRAALRGARRSEVRAESALTPREIQARLRAGETAADVARAAGIPVERVERYEGPVLAERARVVQEARAALLPKDPGGIPGRPLGEVVDARLLSVQDDPIAAQWDAWRRVDGIWLVQLTSDSRCARWTWDPVVRRVRPHDDAARALVAPESVELPPAQPQGPGRASAPALTLVHDQGAPPAYPSSTHGAGGSFQPQEPAAPTAVPTAFPTAAAVNAAGYLPAGHGAPDPAGYGQADAAGPAPVAGPQATTTAAAAHKPAGVDSAGNDAGHQSAGHQSAGHGGVAYGGTGYEPTGYEAAAHGAGGYGDAGATETAGYEASGHDNAGHDNAEGYEPAGYDAAGRGTGLHGAGRSHSSEHTGPTRIASSQDAYPAAPSRPVSAARRAAPTPWQGTAPGTPARPAGGRRAAPPAGRFATRDRAVPPPDHGTPDHGTADHGGEGHPSASVPAGRRALAPDFAAARDEAVPTAAQVPYTGSKPIDEVNLLGAGPSPASLSDVAPETAGINGTGTGTEATEDLTGMSPAEDGWDETPTDSPGPVTAAGPTGTEEGTTAAETSVTPLQTAPLQTAPRRSATAAGGPRRAAGSRSTPARTAASAPGRPGTGAARVPGGAGAAGGGAAVARATDSPAPPGAAGSAPAAAGADPSGTEHLAGTTPGENAAGTAGTAAAVADGPAVHGAATGGPAPATAPTSDAADESTATDPADEATETATKSTRGNQAATTGNRGRQNGTARGGERPTGGRRGRKSVPAWDDIVFGARRP